MKKLITIMLLFGLFLTAAFSQRGENQTTTVNQSLGYTQTWFEYSGLATDTLGVDSTWNYTVGKLTDSRVYGVFYFDLDSIGGTAAQTSVFIQSKMSDADDFINTDTIVWSGNVDTTFRYTTSGVVAADFWNILIQQSSNGFKSKVSYFDGKFIKP